MSLDKTPVKIIRTDSDNSDFRSLVKELDLILSEKDGDMHSYYAQYNKLDKIKNVVVAFSADEPAGCGSVKKFSEDTMEVKRMYVKPEFRGKGYAKRILDELESWSAEMNYDFCILETGVRQTEAVRFYQREGYLLIPNYGQYEGLDLSICMKKRIRS